MEMPPNQVHETFCQNKPEFSVFKDENFASRLRSLRNKVKEKNTRADVDAAALAHDRAMFPRPVQDGCGLPHWADSDAKARLIEDIDTGRCKTMSKEDLWTSSEACCKNYPFDVFVKHCHQEIKSRKFVACCKEQREKKRKMDR